MSFGRDKFSSYDCKEIVRNDSILKSKLGHIENSCGFSF